ncbi:MAG: STAS domain-containing protein [Actinomycetota bacterium]|nr:STAS domain-containing protein [Actinomycetota bacterium]
MGRDRAQRPDVFEFKTHERGSRVVIALFGELDLASVSVLSDERDRMMADGAPQELDIDLRGLDFLDSTGLHLLLRLESRCRTRGSMLALVRGGRAVQKLFQVTGTATQFRFLGSPEAGPSPSAAPRTQDQPAAASSNPGPDGPAAA